MIIDGYVRVSQVAGRSGERFISPDVQREQIEGWAKLHGHLVGRIFEELDQSGARRDRPLFLEAIGRVEQGESNGIVVAKLDRFGRSLADGLAAIDRITTAGGTFVSVRDGLDLSTDTGRLVLRIMLSMAEWELDRIRSTWATAAQRAISRGVRIGPAPFGYLRRADGRLEVDPVRGPLVTEIFRRRAKGATMRVICDSLIERGIRTATGRRHWRDGSAYSILRSRVYLGELSWAEHVNRAAHAPLIDRETWHLAQKPRRSVIRRDAAHVLLRGLVRCAGCRRRMTTYYEDWGTSRERRVYRCMNATSAGRCPARSGVMDSVVEPYVEAVFWQELARGPQGRTSTLRRLEEAVARHDDDLASYRDSTLLPTLGAESFQRGLEVRVRRLERAVLELGSARGAAQGPDLPPPDDLRAHWPEMDLDERRAAIAEVIDCVFVIKGHQAPAERLVVCRRGDAPLDLPVWRLGPEETVTSLDPTQVRSTRPRGIHARPWSKQRVRAALDPFLAGWTEWPSFPEFQAAGLGLVHAQLANHGGAPRWAKGYGLRHTPIERKMGAWSDDRVRAELAVFLAGRTAWPKYEQFKSSERMMLRAAVNSFGGAPRWAEEFGLSMTDRQRRSVGRWSDERIEVEVRRLAGDRPDWPPKRDFVAAGLSGLYHAILRRGGHDTWARRLGFMTRAARGKP